MKAGALFDLAGRTALVTGASSGLGRHFSKLLAENGCAVVLAARRVERLWDLVNEIEAAGGRAVAVRCDVTEAADIAAAFDVGEEAFGPVTVLVNNAGIAVSGRAEALSADDWRRLMATNLDAVFLGAHELARRRIADGAGGSVVNIASIVGIGVHRGLAAYAASKAGVIQLTRALAADWGRHGIRVNAIAPGYVTTDLNRGYLESAAGRAMETTLPLGRFGADGDLDGALLLLASDAGRWMTGATLVVDGGHSVMLTG